MIQFFGERKTSQFASVFFEIKENVFRFHKTMDDALFVNEFKSHGDLREPVPYALLVQFNAFKIIFLVKKDW